MTGSLVRCKAAKQGLLFAFVLLLCGNVGALEMQRLADLQQWQQTQGGPNAYVFDGRTSFAVPVTQELRLGSEGSIDFWVAIGWQGDLGYYPAVIASRDPNSTAYSVHVKSNGAGLLFFNGDRREPVDTPALADGQFHHVALVTQNAQTSVYFDGALVKQLNAGYGKGRPATITLGSSNGQREFFVGAVTNLRVWHQPFASEYIGYLRENFAPEQEYASGLAGFLVAQGASATLQSAPNSNGGPGPAVNQPQPSQPPSQPRGQQPDSQAESGQAYAYEPRRAATPARGPGQQTEQPVRSRPGPRSEPAGSGSAGGVPAGLYGFDGRIPARSSESVPAFKSATIEFWVQPGWDMAEISAEPIQVVRHGSRSTWAWEVYLGPAQNSVGLRTPELEEDVFFDFADGRPHHVVIASEDNKTNFYIDGEAYGKDIPIGLGSVDQRLPISVGEPPFAGALNVRLFNRGLTPERLQQLPRNVAGYDAPQFANLVGFLNDAKRFEVLPESFRPDGVWYPQGEELGKILRGFAYRPQTLATFTTIPAEIERLGAGDNDLAVAMHLPNEDSALRLFSLQQTDRNQFSGAGQSIRMRDRNRLEWNGQLYRRVDPKITGTADMQTFNVDNEPKSMISTEQGYDISLISPWDFNSRPPLGGALQRIFAHEETGKRGAFDVKEGIFVPVGLHYEARRTAEGDKSCSRLTDTQSYYEQLSSGLSIKAGYQGTTTISAEPLGVGASSTGETRALFSRNKQVENSVNSMRSEKKMRCFAGKSCQQHMLQLDKANAALTEEFRQFIEDLKMTRDYQRAIELFGTHYAHAVTYGAKIEKDMSMSEETAQEVISSGTTIENAIDIAVLGYGAQINSTEGSRNSSTVASIVNKEQESFRSIGSTSDISMFQCDKDSVVPVNMDLRPLDELLVPPLFTDGVIIKQIRVELAAAINEYVKAQRMKNISNQVTFYEPEMKGRTYHPFRQRHVASSREILTTLSNTSVDACMKACDKDENNCKAFDFTGNGCELYTKVSTETADAGLTKHASYVHYSTRNNPYTLPEKAKDCAATRYPKRGYEYTHKDVVMYLSLPKGVDGETLPISNGMNGKAIAFADCDSISWNSYKFQCVDGTWNKIGGSASGGEWCHNDGSDSRVKVRKK